MNEITMRVSLEIYQQPAGALRLNEEVTLKEPMTITQAAEVLQKFSDLAQAVKAGRKVSVVLS